MEFIGYAYDAKELILILCNVPENTTVVVNATDTSYPPEVYYDEGRREVILK